MCPCRYRLQKKVVGSRSIPEGIPGVTHSDRVVTKAACRSCNDILIRSGGQLKTGPYWITVISSPYPSRVTFKLASVYLHMI
jgi:hypothetical protein